MASRTSLPQVWILVAWLLIGVIVAINQDYGQQLDNASRVATFMLGVLLWPILAIGGDVAIHF